MFMLKHIVSSQHGINTPPSFFKLTIWASSEGELFSRVAIFEDIHTSIGILDSTILLS